MPLSMPLTRPDLHRCSILLTFDAALGRRLCATLAAVVVLKPISAASGARRESAQRSVTCRRRPHEIGVFVRSAAQLDHARAAISSARGASYSVISEGIPRRTSQDPVGESLGALQPIGTISISSAPGNSV